MSADDTARLLILGAGIDVIVTAILVWAARTEHNAALTERAIVSVILTAIALGAATLGFSRLGVVNVSNDLAIGILSAALLAVTLPQVIWFALWLAGRFR